MSIMTQRHYKVTMDLLNERSIEVNVFINEKASLLELKEMAIIEGIRFMEGLGVTISTDDLKLIGYIDKGVWK
ncbi:hypothetical protein BTR23_07345 [Alkalihalophilus pseudofirmus]|nr:hypothetical protein BTR23_07345 [Alkalihalophilus pseudofirmus]